MTTLDRIRAAQELARLGGPERRAALRLELERQALTLAQLQERNALLAERLETLTEFPVSTFGKVSKKTLVEWVAKKLEQERAA